ncbi:uncharacterized protein LOC121357818 isoform X2 [Pyrgilauda ruficollis]|uniref:uncharacterized protein LOC121357818 isoform X2 n=1 Tax=Pyrgilauda ruficollis TaxID=221976 RepID=UPI001B876E0E|nr:uncharacterized protein LOC121357818 isoform X2 [Pyrgilauda ruficollis]
MSTKPGLLLSHLQAPGLARASRQPPPAVPGESRELCSFRHGSGLARLWLRRPGGIRRDHWLCKSSKFSGSLCFEICELLEPEVMWLCCKCSVPSLAAGLFFGSLAGLGAYQVSQNPNNIWVSLITSGALTAVMGTRFYHSRKFMPAGLIAGVSLLMVGRLALKMLEKPQEK